jgi:hypothetical protein
VLNNLAIIGSEAVGHNVQIFDMNKVAAIDPRKPVTFDTTKDLEGLFDDLPIGRAHNVVIDWDNEYAIAVGAQPRNQTCAAGLEYINLDDPTNPYKPGCASSDGYTHDAQCGECAPSFQSSTLFDPISATAEKCSPNRIPASHTR